MKPFWLSDYYNRKRPHSYHGYLPPVLFEALLKVRSHNFAATQGQRMTSAKPKNKSPASGAWSVAG